MLAQVCRSERSPHGCPETLTSSFRHRLKDVEREWTADRRTARRLLRRGSENPKPPTAWLVGQVNRTAGFHWAQLYEGAARARDAVGTAQAGKEKGRDQGANAEVNRRSAAISDSYTIHIRYSPGLRRGWAVPAPCTERVRKERKESAVNFATRRSPMVYAILISFHGDYADPVSSFRSARTVW